MAYRTDHFDELRKQWDPLCHAQTVIDENHRLIHDGMMFAATYNTASLANGSSVDLLIDVPASTYPHFQELHYGCDGGPMTLYVYEGVTVSAAGTSVTATNRNRNSANTADAVITHTPTVTDTGTLLMQRLITISRQDVIWDQFTGGEVVLKPSTKYLIRLTNGSGQARAVDLAINFYELGYTA